MVPYPHLVAIGQAQSSLPRFSVFIRVVSFSPIGLRTFLPLMTCQVSLVGSIMRSVSNKKSTCHQMIMGAGKTTVVGPLLCLMLADGKQLVTQACTKLFIVPCQVCCRPFACEVVSFLSL